MGIWERFVDVYVCEAVYVCEFCLQHLKISIAL